MTFWFAQKRFPGTLFFGPNRLLHSSAWHICSKTGRNPVV